MKRMSAVFVCVSIFLGALSGCSKDEFVNVLRFTDNLNGITEKDYIEMTGYTIQNGTYYLPLNENGETVLMALETEEQGYIDEIRLTVQKVNEKGEKDSVTELRKNLFVSSVVKAVMAYTYFSSEKAESIVKEMKLTEISSYMSAGEVTHSEGNFHFVYYSMDLCSMFMIYNIHLHPIEKTEKPISRPAFGHTTNIRTETVPLR